jgi:hypothetical protein
MEVGPGGKMTQAATRLDYLHEVEHMRERVERLEQAITEAVQLASPAYWKSSTISRHCAVLHTSRL